MALDLFHLTEDQVIDLIERTDDPVIVSILVDLHWAMAEKNFAEMFEAVGALSDYIVLGLGAPGYEEERP